MNTKSNWKRDAALFGVVTVGVIAATVVGGMLGTWLAMHGPRTDAPATDAVRLAKIVNLVTQQPQPPTADFKTVIHYADVNSVDLVVPLSTSVSP